MFERIVKRFDIRSEQKVLELNKSFTELLLNKVIDPNTRRIIPKKNHGMFAALIVCNYLLDPNKREESEIILEGALPIALHTLDFCEALYNVKGSVFQDVP